MDYAKGKDVLNGKDAVERPVKSVILVYEVTPSDIILDLSIFEDNDRHIKIETLINPKTSKVLRMNTLTT